MSFNRQFQTDMRIMKVASVQINTHTVGVGALKPAYALHIGKWGQKPALIQHSPYVKIFLTNTYIN